MKGLQTQRGQTLEVIGLLDDIRFRLLQTSVEETLEYIEWELGELRCDLDEDGGRVEKSAEQAPTLPLSGS